MNFLANHSVTAFTKFRINPLSLRNSQKLSESLTFIIFYVQKDLRSRSLTKFSEQKLEKKIIVGATTGAQSRPLVTQVLNFKVETCR